MDVSTSDAYGVLDFAAEASSSACVPQRALPLSADFDAEPSLALGPDCFLTAESVESASYPPDCCVTISTEGLQAVERSRLEFIRSRDAGLPIYGVTTGFGPFVSYASADCGGAEHGAGLLAHLGAGSGADAPEPVVRATILLRAQTLTQGYSGIRPELIEGCLNLLAFGILPVIPVIGSVGASGDLVPLSFLARVLAGEGEVDCRGVRMSASQALSNAGLHPLRLEGRDALALTNGVSFLSAYACLAVARAERLISRAEVLTGWAYRLLGCRTQALDERLHRARGHAGQIRSARAIADEAGIDLDRQDHNRPLQEIYSFRCAPQVLGACRENLSFARRIVETEINGVSDNPLFFTEASPDFSGNLAHGGNFHGQQVAFAADALNAAMTQTGILIERQLDALCNPTVNGGAPLLLSWKPGAFSGFAGAQLTATALIAEMRMHAQSYATSSIPTNGGNQDVVSMGALAAREAYRQTEMLAPILAVSGMALAQLNHLRVYERAPGPTTWTPDWMPEFEPLEADRPLQHDIARIASEWLACPVVL